MQEIWLSKLLFFNQSIGFVDFHSLTFVHLKIKSSINLNLENFRKSEKIVVCNSNIFQEAINSQFTEHVSNILSYKSSSSQKLSFLSKFFYFYQIKTEKILILQPQNLNPVLRLKKEKKKETPKETKKS